MAGQKVIKKRIASVTNTKKITKTMEMVATAKSKRMVDRANAAKPYAEKLAEVAAGLSHLRDRVDSPLLRGGGEPETVTMLVVTANRGLCGGYNSNTLKLAVGRIREHQKRGRKLDVRMIGKKGSANFRFLKIPVTRTWLDIDDGVRHEQAAAIASELMEDFASGKTDLVEVVSMVYHGSSRQTPEVNQVLPLALEAEGRTGSGSPICEPDPVAILEGLLPLMVTSEVHRRILEAVTSEQIARRVAMKSATDAAGDMIRSLTRTYNRARQAGITQELSEIVAGADALG